MTVTLALDGYATVTCKLLDFGGIVTPALGGIQQRVNRIGNRWMLTAQLPPMRMTHHARAWIADLNAAQTEGVIARWPQLEFDLSLPGSPRVNGANQTGMTLNADGFTPRFAARKGQYFNIVTGGRHYLEQMRETCVAADDGTMAIALQPMMRARPADNAVLNFGRPMIEGLLQGDGHEWTIGRARTVGLSFTIVEVR